MPLSFIHLSLLYSPTTQELVDELYNFRDGYFETHRVEEAGKKQSDVAQEMERTLKKLEENEGGCCISKTNYMFVIGGISFPSLVSLFSNFQQSALNTKQSFCCRREGV